MSDPRNRNLDAVPTEELARLIHDTSETLAAIRTELERRRQTAEIDRLDELLAEARPKWADIKTFFELMLQELRR